MVITLTPTIAVTCNFQELNQIVVVKLFSEFSIKATNIKLIPNSIFDIIFWAKLVQHGGFYLDWPSDVLHQTFSESEAEKLITDAPNCRNEEEEVMGSVEYSEIENVVSMPRLAERPLIVFGRCHCSSRE